MRISYFVKRTHSVQLLASEWLYKGGLSIDFYK